MSRTAQKFLWPLLSIFATIGLLVLSLRLLGKGMWTLRSPQSVIQKNLWELGFSEQMIRYWTAVSALETDYWKSRVFNDSNNLFCIILQGSKRLQYGEGQTIFESWESSIIGPEGWYKRVIKPYKYPAHVDSIEEFVKSMKTRGYFTSGEAAYLARLKQVYQALYS